MVHQHNRQVGTSSWWRSPTKFALFVFLAVIAFFLIAEHRAHILGLPPLVLILGLCLLMHVFMHRGHGSHGSGDGGNQGGQK